MTDQKLNVEMHETDAELVKAWRQAIADIKAAKKTEEQVVERLGKRAKEMRTDFKDKFTAEGEHSRQATIDGGKEGKVAVEFSAVFDVEENLGIEAKLDLERWARKTRGYYSGKLGEQRVQAIELTRDVLVQVGDRKQKAKLTKSSVTALRAIELPKHTSKALRESIARVIKMLQPLKGKLSVKLIK